MDQKDIHLDRPTYELRPLLAEVRAGYREMRAMRTSLVFFARST